MPITTSARKALRKDRRRTIINKRFRRRLTDAVKKVRKQPTDKTYSFASSILDKAAGRRIIHKNKAARLKSRLAKILKKKPRKLSKG